MTQLIIEYLLEGHRRGYNFTAPEKAQRETLYDDATLKAVWRASMPRGNGWSADRFVGARSIKAFTLPHEMLAVSEVIVTDMSDENGRRGIRRAAVDVMNPALYAHHISSRLAGYPTDTLAKTALLYETMHKATPRLKKDQPLLVAYPYTTAREWWPIEALMLQLALDPPRRLNKHPRPLTFTTLALDYRGEAQMVALPAESAASINDLPVVYLQ